MVYPPIGRLNTKAIDFMHTPIIEQQLFVYFEGHFKKYLVIFSMSFGQIFIAESKIILLKSTTWLKWLFTALHAMQTQSSDENSVCPSVRLSVCLSVCLSVKRVLCDKTVERSVQIYTPYERTFSLVFWEEEWLVGATPSTRNLGQPAPVGAKSPILNR